MGPSLLLSHLPTAFGLGLLAPGSYQHRFLESLENCPNRQTTLKIAIRWAQWWP